MSRRDSAEQNSKPVSRSGTPDPRFDKSNGGDVPIPLYHKPRGKREGLIYRLVALLLQLRLSSASVVLSLLAILLVLLAVVGRRGTDASLQFGDNLLAGSEGIEVRPTVAGDAGDAGEMTWMEVERLARGGARAQDRFGFGSLKGDGGSENVETLATSGEKGTSEKGETGEVVGSSGISAVDSVDWVDFKNLVVHAAIDLPDFILVLLRPLAPSNPPKSDVAAGYTAADVAAAAGNRSSEEASSGIFRNARFGRARVSQEQLERIKGMECSFGEGSLTARTRVLQVSADGLDAVGDVGDLSDVSDASDVGDERSSSSGGNSDSSRDRAEGATGGSSRRRLATVGVSQEQRGDTGVGRPPPLVYDAVTVRRRERKGREGREGRGRGYDGREEKGDTVEGEEGEEREGREGVYLFVRGLQTNPHLPPVLANVTCVFGADGGIGGAGAGGSGGKGERGNDWGSVSEGAEQEGLLRVPARAAAMEVVFCPLPAYVGADGGTANSSSSGSSSRDGTGVGAAGKVADLTMRAVTVEYEGRLFPSVALFDPVDPFDQPEAPHGQQEGGEGSNGQHSSDGSRFGDVLNTDSAGNGSSTNVGSKQDAGVEAAEEVGDSMVGQSGLNGIVGNKRRRKEKPHFVCMCTMIFNVGKFLREWVVYHHWMGVDRIFLYDNNSEDNTTAVVASLAADGGARLVVGTPAGQAAAAVVAEAAAPGGGGGKEGRLGGLEGGAMAGGEAGIEGAKWWVRAGFVGSTQNQSHGASPSLIEPSSPSSVSSSSTSSSSSSSYSSYSSSSSSSSAPHSHPSTPVVTVHPWPWIKSQQAGFSHCVLRAARQCEWVGFIDVDEFVASKFIAHIAEKRKDLGEEVREKGVFIPHLLRRVGKGGGEGGKGGSRRRRMAGGGRREVRGGGDGEERRMGGGVREREGEEVRGVAGAADVAGARESGGVGGGVGRRLLAGGDRGLTEHPQQGVSVGYTCRARKPDRHKSFVRPEAVADSLLCHIHQFELKEEKYRSQVFSGRVRLANINHYKFQVGGLCCAP
ncbi:unnamed protein product [Closterium sp. Naga37s-1]|nr:unnamed protein product [Closterium sp. Naga37s-1]